MAEERKSQRRGYRTNKIAQLVSNWTGIPVSQMLEGESEKLLQMEDRIHERLIDRRKPSQAIFRGNPPEPLRFEGPETAHRQFPVPGADRCRKTEIARTLAWFLFDDENAMVRLDMSEYQEKAYRFPAHRLTAGLCRL